jgi:hypothetical protein
LPISDLPRPANFEKMLKFLRKGKAQREARNAAEKDLELRNYGSLKAKTGQVPRQRIITNDNSWLGRGHMQLNLSSVDSAEASNRSELSCRSPSPPPSARTGTVRSAPTTPNSRSAIDMLLFPANVSCGTDGGGTTHRERQVMMARLMSTPDKLPAHRTTTSRKVREDKQRAEAARKEEEEERHRGRLRQLAQMTAERVKTSRAKTQSSSTRGPLNTTDRLVKNTQHVRPTTAPAKTPTSIPRPDSNLTNASGNKPGREGSSSFQKACAMLL